MADTTPPTMRRYAHRHVPGPRRRATSLRWLLLLTGIVLTGCGAPPQAPPPLEEQGRTDLRTVESAPRALVGAP